MSRTVKITHAPFQRNKDTVQSLMGDMLIVMPFLYAMPVVFYGFRIIKNLIVSLAVCYTLDMLFTKWRHKDVNYKDISSLVTGCILPLLFPASISVWIIVSADIFAMAIAKHTFGGLGNNPFNPAAAAYCFCAVSWTEKVYSFTKPMVWLKIFGQIGEDVKIVETAAQNLHNGGRPNISVFDIFSGNVAGAAGVTCVIVMVAAFAYLMYRHTITVQIPVAIIVTVAVFSVLFPRVSTGVVDSVFYEINSGALIFGAVFMATEPVSSPKHPYAKWIYGACIGIITMLFRHFGKMEIAIPFAIIIVNSFTPFLDKIGMKIDKQVDVFAELSVRKKVNGEGNGHE